MLLNTFLTSFSSLIVWSIVAGSRIPFSNPLISTMFLTLSIRYSLVSPFSNDTVLINAPFTHGQLGALLPPGNETLRDCFNLFLQQLRQTGRLAELEAIHLRGEK